jgi:hypothetical protein
MSTLLISTFCRLDSYGPKKSENKVMATDTSEAINTVEAI